MGGLGLHRIWYDGGLAIVGIAAAVTAVVPSPRDDRPIACADAFVDALGLVYVTDAIGGLHYSRVSP